ncbi:MAG: hypothetical protein ABI406_04960 [Ktedonobacteraceae bacterium]
MGKLDYNGNTHLWEGSIETDEDFFHVHMTDTTFRTYFHAYLESLDIPTQSYLEMMAYVDRVGREQYEALQQFTADLERWRDCKDIAVRIYAQQYRRNVVAIEDNKP